MEAQLEQMQQTILILSGESSVDKWEISHIAPDAQLQLVYLAIRKHGIGLTVIREFHRRMSADISRDNAEELIIPFTTSFLECLQELPSAKTRSDIQQILDELMKREMTRSTAEDWKSLFHILTRPKMLPIDLSSLAAYSNVREARTIVDIRSDHIRVYDCISEVWGEKVMLSGFKQIPSVKAIASAFLPNGNVFACGGCNPYVADTFEINIKTGEVIKFPDLSWKLCANGLLPYFKYVYSFGGWIDANFAYSVKFSLKDKLWLKLPTDMLTPRHAFTPILHKHIIYICGGYGTNKSEMFDPTTEIFSPLSFTLPEQIHSRDVIFGDKIYVFQSNNVTKIDLNSNYRLETVAHGGYRVTGYMGFCVFGSAIWFNDWDKTGIYQVNAESGVLEKTIAVPT